MQPSEIKRAIRNKKPGTKISANNIRDITKLLLEKQIVQKVYVRKKAHPQYKLSDSGNQFSESTMTIDCRACFTLMIVVRPELWKNFSL